MMGGKKKTTFQSIHRNVSHYEWNPSTFAVTSLHPAADSHRSQAAMLPRCHKCRCLSGRLRKVALHKVYLKSPLCPQVNRSSLIFETDNDQQVSSWTTEIKECINNRWETWRQILCINPNLKTGTLSVCNTFSFSNLMPPFGNFGGFLSTNLNPQDSDLSWNQ